MSQTDPFSDTVRLNQLNEKELLLRNERMVNPQLRQFYHLTDEERNHEYHKYYTGLSQARVNEMIQQGRQEETELLPYGWNERLALTKSITSFAEEIPVSSSSTIDESAEQQANPSQTQPTNETTTQSTPSNGNGSTSDAQSDKQRFVALFLEAGEEVKRLQYEVRDRLADLSAAEKTGDELSISQAKRAFEIAREEFQHAQNKENTLLQLISGP